MGKGEFKNPPASAFSGASLAGHVLVAHVVALDRRRLDAETMPQRAVAIAGEYAPQLRHGHPGSRACKIVGGWSSLGYVAGP